MSGVVPLVHGNRHRGGSPYTLTVSGSFVAAPYGILDAHPRGPEGESWSSSREIVVFA